MFPSKEKAPFKVIFSSIALLPSFSNLQGTEKYSYGI
jgi:hypothetical protein